MEALNITFIKKVGDDTNLDVICSNSMASGEGGYSYIGNTLSFKFTSVNTFVSTFDGGNRGFEILKENIQKLTGNLITHAINENLKTQNHYFGKTKGLSVTSTEKEFIDYISGEKNKYDTMSVDDRQKFLEKLNGMLKDNATDHNVTKESTDRITSSFPEDLQKFLKGKFNVYSNGLYSFNGGGEHRKTLKKRT